MANRPTNRFPPDAASPAPEADKGLTDTPRITRNSTTPSRRDDTAKLEEAETMLRTAIQAMSPAADEINEGLARAQHLDTAKAKRPLNIGLVLTVVALVVLILGLDLLLAGT